MPLFIVGVKKPPEGPPDYFGLGDENDAFHYLSRYGRAWVNTPGALTWFVEEFEKVLREIKEDSKSAIHE